MRMKPDYIVIDRTHPRPTIFYRELLLWTAVVLVAGIGIGLATAGVLQ